MQELFFKILISVFLISNLISGQTIAAQTATADADDSGEEKIWLRGDLRASDVVVYVNVKEKKLIDFIGNNPDCDNDTGAGYCRYLLKGDVREVFKGKEIGKTIEFYMTPDADYPKKYLLGEKIVFLVRSENKESKTNGLYAIENSSRPLIWLDAMRKISDPKSAIDEEDEFELYSLKGIRKQMKDADAVIYADVKSFQAAPEELSPSDSSLMKSEVVEVFKGDLKSGQEFEFIENLLYRPVRNDDLGKQIIFLEKREDGDKIFYERIRYTITNVEHDILEKLRKISKEN